MGFYTTVKSHSWQVILASTLWQPLLPVGGPTWLYVSEHDEWLPEPEGVLMYIFFT